MNPLNINHIKEEKANAIKLRCQNIRKITIFFRFFEIFLIIAVISRISFQFPLTVFKLSNECIQSLNIFIFSPPFVFILGNAIVITLFVNSGKLNNSPKSNVKPPKIRQIPRKNSSMEPKYVKKQEKVEENTIMATIFSTPQHQVIKIYNRSKSEKIKREKIEKRCCGLQRSNTELKNFEDENGWCCKEKGEGKHYPEDHMSSDEFRRTIEDFIAKQQKFLREECYAFEE